MNIVILSRERTLFSCYRLFDSAEKRGHTVNIIDPCFCHIKVNNTPNIPSSIYFRGKKLEFYDAVIPRIGPLTTSYSITILRQLEILGSLSINKSSSIFYARNKLHTLQMLTNNGIDVPVTSVSYSSENKKDIIDIVQNFPLIIKLIKGTQGIGVILAETRQSADSIIDALYSLKVQFLVQEFISEANGCDIRCFVVGNKVVAAVERKSKLDGFRSNFHLGGTVRPIKISSFEEAIAIRATIALELNIAGVDIVRANRGPLVIDVNASPGLKGIETASNINIAEEIIYFIEKCLTLPLK